MIVVSDSTTLIVLANSQRFDLLSNLFSCVYVPKAVWQEINIKAGLHFPEWIQVVDVAPDDSLPLLLHLLDQGESEAILLAKQRQLPLIIDEKKGRKIALQMKIDILGLLGVVLANIKRQHISEIEAHDFIALVRQAGYRIAQPLVDAMFHHLHSGL